jgi:hypothetical protein
MMIIRTFPAIAANSSDPLSRLPTGMTLHPERSVMITRNDYQFHLFGKDVGDRPAGRGSAWRCRLFRSNRCRQ